jgi:hypothetical protein
MYWNNRSAADYDSRVQTIAMWHGKAISEQPKFRLGVIECQKNVSSKLETLTIESAWK